MVTETVFILHSRMFFSIDLSTRPSSRMTESSLELLPVGHPCTGINVSLYMEKVPIRFTYKHSLVELNGSI